MADQPHVVILGAGFGGVGAVQKLRDAGARITIIDQHDYHTFQPLLYQVATAELDTNEIGFPIRDLLHKHTNVAFHQTAVERIDLTGKQVAVVGMPPIAYDYLILALGARVNFFDTPGAQEHSLPLYTMDDALRLKEHILKTVEAVDKNPALVDDGALTFCIVGGGPTGVELAGALSELIRAELTQDYPNLPMSRAKLQLYEHSPHLLGPFEPKLQVYAKSALEQRGVEVHTGTGVSKVGPTSIELSTGESVKTHTLVWAAGLQANPVTATLGVELGHGGRVPVGADLQVQGHPGCFAVGDIASASDETGKPLPGLGAVALQAGHYVGEAIKQLIAGEVPKPFHYIDKGTMAQVGRGAAVVELPGGRSMTGLLAWVTWLGVHLSLLNGAEEKSTAFVDWGWNLLTHERSKRILLSDEDFHSPGEASSSTNREITK